MRWHLPPPRALIALESVVRTGSVSLAAEELCVTQSAVSKQIAVLEEWLGQPLFEPNRRRMVPTQNARQLADAAGVAWGMLAAAVSEVAHRGGIRLNVIAPATFAMRWLLPRLPSFQAECPAIKVSVRQTHTPESWLELPFDVAIRRGDQAPQRLSATEFLKEELVLVAKTGASFVAEANPNRLPLIEADTRPGELVSWFHAARARLREEVHLASLNPARFAHFYIALEAALKGQGALVAPSVIVQDLIEDGTLTRLFPEIRVQGPSYWIGFDKSNPQAAAARVFASWVRRTADAAPPPGSRAQSAIPMSMTAA